MHNVEWLRRRVKRELQYGPDVVDHRMDVRETLDDEHKLICGDDDWDFLMKEEAFLVLPTLPIAGVEGNQLVSTLVTVVPSSEWRDATVGGTSLLYSAEETSAYVRRLSLLLNGEIHVTSALTSSGQTANWDEAPFAIEGIKTGAAANSVLLELDPRVRATQTIASGEIDGVDLEVRFYRWRLPTDCSKLMGLHRSDGTELQALATQGPRWLLDQTQEGEPRCYFPNYGMTNQGVGRGLTPELQTIAGAVITTSPPTQNSTQFATNRYISQMRNEPYVGGFTLAVANGGNLKASQKYKVFVTWSYGGRLSAPSETKEISTTATDLTITLDGLIGTEALTAAVGQYARRLVVWMAEEEGEFYPAIVLNQLELEQNPVGTVGLTNFVPGGHVNGANDYVHPWEDAIRHSDVFPGEYQYISLYPRPDRRYTYLMRYLRRPRSLVHDADIPEIPEQFAPVLVHAAARRFASRHRDSSFYKEQEEQYKLWLSKLRARHGQQLKRRPRKGRIDVPSRRGQAFVTNINYISDT